MKNSAFALVLAAFSVSCASAQEAPPAAAQPPAQINPVGGPSATKPLTPDSDINQILDALHARGSLMDFAGEVSLQERDALSGDTKTFIGKVWYQAADEKGSRIRVVFPQQKTNESPPVDHKREYMLDKGWLIERDFKNKNEIRRQGLEEGQKIDLLKLGEGPFPLPIGQPREAVLEQFTVEKVADESKALPGTVHILLKPKPGTRFARKFASFDVWVDLTTHFPKRIQTRDPGKISIKTTDFSNIQVNQGLKDQEFVLEPVKGWNVFTEKMID